MAANLAQNELADLFGYLSLDSREDVKTLALEYMLGLTGSVDGMKFMENNVEFVEKVVELTKDKSPGVQKEACTFLLNASASEIVARKLENPKTFELILPQVVDKECIFAEKAAMLLSNLTRSEQGCEMCCKVIEKSSQYSFEKIFNVLYAEKYNKNVEMHHLTAFLSNMSRLKVVRMFVLDQARGLLQKLLPYLGFQKSVVRRKGIVGIIRNCCFEYDHHDWLLSDDIDILPILLLPLAGPEEFSETEIDQLPLDLQYLGDDKEREIDAEIRLMLVECLMMLCSTKSGRQYIKEKNAYVIIRELHKWEKDENVCKAIENLVQILIGDEPEDSLANLHQVEIPEKIREQFESCDAQRN